MRMDPAKRSAEILTCASRLFHERGIGAVTIDDIVRAANVAKGTFYLYYRSKSDLLAKLADALIRRMAETAEAAAAQAADPLDQFAAAVAAMRTVGREGRHLAEALDHPDNFELHERTNVTLVRTLAPILGRVVEAGNTSGVFNVADPVPTIEFLLAGQAFLLGDGRFAWSEAEYRRRLDATLTLIERALGASPGSLAPRLGAVVTRPAAGDQVAR